ncbi:MAG: IS1595 family transposase [Acidobacteria bacterium]|nr:IS1595 family transposase [Acidobacteriota bacterium]
MEDYPRNLTEFDVCFDTDEACREYLVRLRWPDGFQCPRCGCGKSWPVREVLLQCADCGYQTSVTAGTIFQDTRTPLRLWFQAMWWITTQKNGASALGLQQMLGLKQYQTAWTWLHKLRSAMVRPGRDLLSGRVEVDESYLGGLEEGLRGRKTETKALIIVAAQEDGRGMGRIRMRHIPDASAQSLHRFVQDSIAPGSVVHTDGWRGYSGLDTKGYLQEVTVLKGKKEPASELLPRVHRIISLLKRWLMGTHQGAVSHKHLAYYLDEFTFRFNRRKSPSRGKLFFRLVQQAVAVDPSSYDMIVGKTRAPTQETRPQAVGVT